MKKTEKFGAGGWSVVLTAAAVMLATLPGRTQGLSLITEPMIAELGIDRFHFANLNLWATLVGALFCFPAGWLFDRYGLRWPTLLIIMSLALVTAAVSVSAGSSFLLLLLLTGTRGLGQSALSVASITAVGKRFGKEAGMPMAIFAIALSLFFAIAFGLIGYAVRTVGWRAAWLQVALVLAIGIAPLALLFLRGAEGSKENTLEQPAPGLTLLEALRTRAFWIFGGAAALFNLVSSGFGLFNEAILAENGFDQKTFHIFLGVTTLLSLVGQFFAGWLSRRMQYQGLTSLALGIYAVGLLCVPVVKSITQLMLVSVLVGIAGGMIIVVFFSVWAEAFGRRQLGRIQGAAQFLTVVSSAIGPVLFAASHDRNGSYAPLIFGIAVMVAMVSLLARATPAPVIPERASACA